MIPAMQGTRISSILGELNGGNSDAWDRLAPLVYNELRRQASRQLRREGADSVLQPSALVNEVYLRLANEPNRQWNDRGHFYTTCAQVMRRILVDASRRRKALKRGGSATDRSLDAALPSVEPTPVDWQALHEALARLEELNERQHRIVELHYFVGLSFQEIADLFGVTTKTVQRDWVAARTWLYSQLTS